jgi:hypothetical protein
LLATAEHVIWLNVKQLYGLGGIPPGVRPGV